MGRGMCKNLVEKGDLDGPLVLFNRSKQRAIDFSATLPTGKSSVVSSIDEAVSQSDIIFTCVGDDTAMQDTLAIALKENVNGKLFVDCSTIHPDTTNVLAQTLEARGAQFVACPVFGAPAMADSGQLVCVLAGPAAAVERVKPYTKGVIGRANLDFSDQPQGKATLLKIIGNTFVLNLVESIAEGHTLAEMSELGTNNLHQFIEVMFPGPYSAYSGRMISGDYYKREEPLFNVDLARKDAGHALKLADDFGAKMKALEAADGHLAVVQRHVVRKGDITGIYGAVRQESGLNFELG